jgi:hypothetical protein
MSDTPELNTPRLHVVMEDGAAFDVQARNKDLVLWDRESVKRGWPEAQRAPFVWMNFLAWRCLLREQLIPPDMALGAFEDACLEVSSEKGAAVDPSLPGATDGSVSP